MNIKEKVKSFFIRPEKEEEELEKVLYYNGLPTEELYIKNNDQIISNSQELDELLKDLNEIKNISTDMNRLLSDQTDKLDTIEDNVEATTHNIKVSDIELKKAIKYKKDAQLNMITTTSGAIAGSFFGPVGSIAGAGIGLVVSTVYNILS